MTDEMSAWAETIMRQKYLHPGEETWQDIADRVAEAVVGPYFPDFVPLVAQAIGERKFMPGGRFLALAGQEYPQTNNCFLMRAEDSREGWADTMRKATSALMSGGGVGIVYSDLRGKGSLVRRTGGKSSGPLGLMEMVNEAGRHIMAGGNRRAALWAGLHWWHPDIFDFIQMKDWDEETVARKAKDFSAPARMDGTNISVILDDDFFALLNGECPTGLSYGIGENEDLHFVDQEWAEKVYRMTVEHMVATAEPGFSVDTGENFYENLRNPCCEITSEDPDDVCCLGSINLARIEDINEMARMVDIGSLFLLCGTLYSKVPYPEVEATREKNRRIGLGLMGVHEWLIARGKPYAPDEELAEWLEVYKLSRLCAAYWAKELGVSAPVKTRAIAPTGTIGILAETTTGIEPLFATAYQRRYLGADREWKVQFVVDATAQRMADKYGIDPDDIETAYKLARDPERRIAFQAWVQGYVDHAISSTLNLPAVDEHVFTAQEFGDMLLPYLPKLRGITAYPDGARGGQPLTVVDYSTAWANEGVEFSEDGLDQACVTGSCGV